MAELPAPGDESTLYVVDVMGFVFRSYHALPPMVTSKGVSTHALYGVAQQLLSLINRQQPRYLAIALDPNGPSFRKEIFPDYKLNRRERPPDLNEQLLRLPEVLESFSAAILKADSFEADDLIAAITHQAVDAGWRVVVVAADKDLLQLVGPSVVMLDTMRDRVYGPEETLEKLGVYPNQVRDYFALTGDSSDNVPGVPSVGPKTAAKLLGEYGTLEGVYEALGEIKRKALKAKLTDHREDALLSQRLVTLRADAPVTFEPESLAFGGLADAPLRELFGRYEFHGLFSQLKSAPLKEASHRVEAAPGSLESVFRAAKADGLAFYTFVDEDDLRRGSVHGISLAPSAQETIYYPFESPDGLTAFSRSLQAGVGEVSLFAADAKRERLIWNRVEVDLPITFDLMLASYLIDPERHRHSIEEIAQTDFQRELTPYRALAGLGGLLPIGQEEAARFAGARAEIVWRGRAAMVSRLEGQGLLELLGQVEIPLTRVLAKMEAIGICVDADMLRTQSQGYEERLAELEAQAFALAGHEFKIGSPRALETILFDELELPVVKRTKTARSTDAEVLEELGRQHELPRVVGEHRMLSKLKSTYLDALPKQIDKSTGRVHTRINQAVAATGRMSSSDPNLQNIPIRTEIGRAIRSAFTPAQGLALLSADYSQVELRVLAHLSSDRALCDAFRSGKDVHVRTATALFDVPEHEVTKEMRGAAKTVNYAVIYGQTQYALARNLDIERDEAQRYIDAFFTRYAGVSAFMDATIEQARAAGGVRTMLGRWRSIPDIRSRNRGLRAAAERIARNTPIQGTAADLMKVAMVQIDESAHGLRANMLLTVHDELVFEVHPEDVEALTKVVKERMENAIALDVPLKVDVGVGSDWNAAH